MNGRFLLFLIIFILDQLTKYWANTNLLLNQPQKIIDGIFNLTLVYNKGAAFGMFSGMPDPWRHIALWG
ncbi:MAG: signal peptidase II, partial [Proteobacteria bacterium]|nr:signal peptidase II [Pseudomonadota bacterium]